MFKLYRDMRVMTPRTAAGRALLAHVKPSYTPPGSGRDFRAHVLAIEAAAAAPAEGLDVARLAAAIVEVEEAHLNLDCLSDQCEHPEGECPEYAIGCGDGAEIAAAYAALAQPAAPAEGLGDRMYEALKDGATAGGSYDEGWRDALDIAAQWLWLDR